jgi:acyl-CoA dehydrogenase
MEPSIGPDPALVSAVSDFFAATSAAQPIEDTPVDASSIERAWSATADLDLTLVGISEEQGGSGGSLADLLAVLIAMANHAISLPLAETSLAAWLLTTAGSNAPAGPATVAPGDTRDVLLLNDGRVSGRLHDVPWAAAVPLVAAMAQDPAGHTRVVSFDPAAARLRAGRDLAGQPRDFVELTDVRVECAPDPVPRADLFWRGALLRAAQIAGAIEAVGRITRKYTAERVQFGRPIGTFQAVQLHIVTIAQAAEITAMGVSQAARASATRPGTFEICAAKLLADEQARVAVRAAHQAHGAIGMTREYGLHGYTRRLNAWRQEFGTEQQLALALGAAAGSAPSFSNAISDHDNGIEVTWPIST